ncbi:uncharacterized protein LOC134187263 [Corticium candelabrum]|uniref:uncharacterized protein LOC134187263 n=1 Tax=Corticium candelabrum TaxID=121492 RepID=UPI002E261CA3|nr:uncharacterized protein LOC134187263 [Corticium candelabrum]
MHRTSGGGHGQTGQAGQASSQSDWTMRERLVLSSSVLNSGDQNWVSVSRIVKPLLEAGVKQPDQFSQKNCALEYSDMLEKVAALKRKRSTEIGTGETPGERIVRRLTFERIKRAKEVNQDATCTVQVTRPDTNSNLPSKAHSKQQLRLLLTITTMSLHPCIDRCFIFSLYAPIQSSTPVQRIQTPCSERITSGLVYKKADVQADIDAKKRDKFWSDQEVELLVWGTALDSLLQSSLFTWHWSLL